MILRSFSSLCLGLLSCIFEYLYLNSRSKRTFSFKDLLNDVPLDFHIIGFLFQFWIRSLISTFCQNDYNPVFSEINFCRNYFFLWYYNSWKNALTDEKIWWYLKKSTSYRILILKPHKWIKYMLFQWKDFPDINLELMTIWNKQTLHFTTYS